jgi:3-oxoacyl-[acyl-carrier-protein] synthase II
MSGQVCITGIGVRSAIGNTPEAFAESLRTGITGIGEQSGIFRDRSIWVGLASRNDEGESAQDVDCAALLALHAGCSAWSHAFAASQFQPDRSRVALILGTSHGGRSQIDYCLESPQTFETNEASIRILERSPHFRQSEFVARRLGIKGPVVTISTACSSSNAAILYGMDLLNAHRVDYVLAGGMDGFSKLTHAGFRALGAVSDGACAPFSDRIGISLGEGAAVVVLERLADAIHRGADVRSELYGAGSSWDCYHMTEPEPSGEGLLRALEMAACRSNVRTERAFDYLNLHGTGTRANDAAETLAVKRFFGLSAIPPASSVKSFTGHTLGASGAMGVIAAVLGMQNDFLPPTVNYAGARPGCDLDYVPNHSRQAKIESFSAQSAGFGGVNVVVMGGRQRQSTGNFRTLATPIVVSGVGVVSAAGIGMTAFRESLRAGRIGIGPIDRFDVSHTQSKVAGLIRDFQPRKLAPTLNLRRIDLCFQFAAVAVAEALASSTIATRGIDSKSIGLVVGTTRGAVNSFEHSMKNVMGSEWDQTSAIHFPNLVMSSLGGYISKMFSLQGAASTLVCGGGGGLQAIAHAFELLRSNPTQQAIVVVLADELSPLFFQLFDQSGKLARGNGGLGGRVYDCNSQGFIMGEGAAAFVLEKGAGGEFQNGQLSISGYGMTCDSEPDGAAQASGVWLTESIQQALREAKLEPADIDLIYGHGNGTPGHDERELRALARVCAPIVPLSCVLPNTGFAESASAGFSLAAAAMSLRYRETYPIVSLNPASHGRRFVRDHATGLDSQHILLTSSSDGGNNTALVLSKST